MTKPKEKASLKCTKRLHLPTVAEFDPNNGLLLEISVQNLQRYDLSLSKSRERLINPVLQAQKLLGQASQISENETDCHLPSSCGTLDSDNLQKMKRHKARIPKS